MYYYSCASVICTVCTIQDVWNIHHCYHTLYIIHLTPHTVTSYTGDDFSGNRMWPGMSWRPFAVVCSIPAAIALVLTHTILPESPRFLVGKLKYKEAVSECVRELVSVLLRLKGSDRYYNFLARAIFDPFLLASHIYPAEEVEVVGFFTV